MDGLADLETEAYWDEHHHDASADPGFWMATGRFDGAFFHQSLHHVRSIEKLLARVRRR